MARRSSHCCVSRFSLISADKLVAPALHCQPRRCHPFWKCSMAVTLDACPELTYCILQAGDYLTNSVYVLFPALLLLYFADKHSESKWTLGFAVLFGFALSSRANYFLLVPIVFFALLRIRNFSYALKHMARGANPLEELVIRAKALTAASQYLYRFVESVFSLKRR